MGNNLKKLITNLDYIQYGKALFENSSLHFGHGTSTPYDEAAYIVLTITGDMSINDEAIYAKTVSDEHQLAIKTGFERRVSEKIPAAYILGEAWFLGLAFYVDESVLIPRSPFAELIFCEFEPWLNADSVRSILDLCTGSGCIGIACATVFEQAAVDIADISTAALAVANKNIIRHQLNNRVTAMESNLFRDLPPKQYDLIVTNPPYVGREELENLPDEFHKEPQLGLDGGETGLDLVHEILLKAPDFLTDDGLLYVEVGNSDLLLQELYPLVPFLWQEFEYGGHGVFMLTKGQLLEHKQQFLVNLPN
ncbi:MAG: 50S ribosomal protein L3 N(5)-glutamine methyltransferase [Piscirickettsiaceae bacterium]|nr:MAG: 50S ribosomal protein L3 N(5)-glutamine methyltransferase [Piscirickettsiaceae bacterium]